MPYKRDRNRRDHSAIWLMMGALIVVGGLVLFVSRAGAPPEAALPDGAELSATGVASSGGVVVEGSEIMLGVVPLNFTITPTWTLQNDGPEEVHLGEPHASVVEGCCPGPLTLSVTTLGPGEEAELTFPLQMHPGMDGPHRFDIHVPVGSDGEYLTLGVTGDFG